MGTINILARRRKDGIVEYGWSGSWHDKNIGQVLLDWYSNDAMVDYLFGLGQVANLNARCRRRVVSAAQGTVPVRPATHIGRQIRKARSFHGCLLSMRRIFTILTAAGIT